jgi:hypothetical protein
MLSSKDNVICEHQELDGVVRKVVGRYYDRMVAEVELELTKLYPSLHVYVPKEPLTLTLRTGPKRLNVDRYDTDTYTRRIALELLTIEEPLYVS